MRVGSLFVSTSGRAHRRKGLISVFAPVVIGVGVAFAWNGAASLQADQSGGMNGVAPQIDTAVQQAAAQTWVSAVTTQPNGSQAQGNGGCHPRPEASAPVVAARHPVAVTHRHPRSIGTADIWCAVQSGSQSE
jgi:hypothetical protein